MINQIAERIQEGPINTFKNELQNYIDEATNIIQLKFIITQSYRFPFLALTNSDIPIKQ